jgi:uncharacterized protein DUF3554
LKCIVATPNAAEVLEPFVTIVKAEANKGSLAPGNYFVLTEWCCILLGEFTQHQDLWSKWSLPLVEALAVALERTCSQSKKSLEHSAIVSTRRALRRVFRHETLASKAIPMIVSTLCNKAASPTARNAILLGVVAGVCARITGANEVFSAHKKECFAFYIRELIGSRIRLSDHLVEGLNDLFAKFVTMEDLQKDIIPATEKALLRAPEIVLNNLVSPMINALPSELDLSEILQKNLMKPLLSNTSSTNADIRYGALRTFKSLAVKSHSETSLNHIVDDLIKPWKQMKITTADSKAIYSEMLGSLSSSASIIQKIVPWLGSVAVKEANESALEAQIKALSKHALFGLKENIPLDSPYSEYYLKGLSDKKVSVRRIWALQVGEILWSLPNDVLVQSQLSGFITSIFSNSSYTLKEIVANPNTAAQSGLAATVYVLTALCLDKLQHLKDANGKDIAPKEVFLKAATTWDGKPSYLVNPRIFAKLVSPMDSVWAIRALLSASDAILVGSCKAEFENAWIQTALYFLTSPSLDPIVRREASDAFTKIYAGNPEKIGSLLIDGLWTWLRNSSAEEKDSISVHAKSDVDTLVLALQCICLSPSQLEELHCTISEDVLESQMIDLLVLARNDLIPRTSWIDLCLKVGIDPGKLVSKHSSVCLEQVRIISSVSNILFWKAILIISSILWMPSHHRQTLQPIVLLPI